MTITTTTAFVEGVRQVQADLATLEQAAYAIPGASSIRPVISEARATVNHAGFTAQLSKVERGEV